MAEGFTVTWLQANLSFSSGLLLFDLYVGSNWNLSDGQGHKKAVCLFLFFFLLSTLEAKRGKEQ